MCEIRSSYNELKSRLDAGERQTLLLTRNAIDSTLYNNIIYIIYYNIRNIIHTSMCRYVNYTGALVRVKK